MKLAQRIEDVLTCLYDYEYINLEKFYNDKGNNKLLEVLNHVLDTHEADKKQAAQLDDLHDIIDNFIKFETNYCSEIGDF